MKTIMGVSLKKIKEQVMSEQIIEANGINLWTESFGNSKELCSAGYIFSSLWTQLSYFHSHAFAKRIPLINDVGNDGSFMFL